MADFIQNSNVKTAVRALANPIADIAAFNLIVQSVITDNPFACVAYMTGGESHPAVEKTRESYTVKIVFEDSNAKNIGNDSAKYNTIAGFTAGATALLGRAAVSRWKWRIVLHQLLISPQVCYPVPRFFNPVAFQSDYAK